MINDWWIDAAALVLMLLFGTLFWLLERTHVGVQKAREQWRVEATAERGPASGLRRWLYPATLIRQAGWYPPTMAPLYWSAKLVLATLLPLLMLEWQDGRLHGALAGVLILVGLLLPDLWLLQRRRLRQRRISQSLGFFIHLMVVYLESGSNLMQAFRQAAEQGLHPRHPLAHEVDLIHREMDAGQERDLAFRRLAERTGVSALQRLASVISVAYQAGSPVVETLKAQGLSLQSQQAQQATEWVQRKSMEAMLPLLLVSFPMFLVLVLFPAVVQLLDVLTMIGEVF